jgi:hypothetical protein
MLRTVEVVVALDGQVLLEMPEVLVEVEVLLPHLVDLQDNQQQILVLLNMEIPVVLVVVHFHLVVAVAQVLQEILIQVQVKPEDTVV